MFPYGPVAWHVQTGQHHELESWRKTHVPKPQTCGKQRAKARRKAKLRKGGFMCSYMFCLRMLCHFTQYLTVYFSSATPARLAVMGSGHAWKGKGCTDYTAQIGTLRRLLRVATKECAAKQAQRWDRTEFLQMSCRSHCLESEEFDYILMEQNTRKTTTQVHAMKSCTPHVQMTVSLHWNMLFQIEWVCLAMLGPSPRSQQCIWHVQTWDKACKTVRAHLRS